MAVDVMADTHHQPMPVRRIEGRVEPPLDQSWPDLEKLRWHAGVVLGDCGVSAVIVTNCYSEPDWRGRQRFRSDIFGVMIDNATLVGLDFDAAWHYLNGVRNGAQAVGGRS